MKREDNTIWGIALAVLIVLGLTVSTQTYSLIMNYSTISRASVLVKEAAKEGATVKELNDVFYQDARANHFMGYKINGVESTELDGEDFIKLDKEKIEVYYEYTLKDLFNLVESDKLIMISKR